MNFLQNPAGVTTTIHGHEAPTQAKVGRKIIATADAISILADYVYLFGVTSLRECPAIRHVTFAHIHHLPSFELGEGLKWVCQRMMEDTHDAPACARHQMLMARLDSLKPDADSYPLLIVKSSIKPHRTELHN